MNIKTKFKINDEVYIIFKEVNEPYLKILKDVVKQIIIDENGITYFCSKMCEEFNEFELVNKKDINKLIPIIKNLLREDLKLKEEIE